MVTCLCADSRGYGIVAPLSALDGRSAIVLIPPSHFRDDLAAMEKVFGTIRQVDDLVVTANGNDLFRFRVIIARHFSGSAPGS